MNAKSKPSQVQVFEQSLTNLAKIYNYKNEMTQYYCTFILLNLPNASEILSKWQETHPMPIEPN